MTSQTSPIRPPSPRSAALTLALLAAALGNPLTGCEKKKPPPPPPPPPVVIPPPPTVDMEALAQELDSDARVQFAEGAVPTDRALAEGAIHLADAFARGDSAKLRGLLDRKGQQILDDLVSRDEWQSATGKIEAVRIVHLSELGGGNAGGTLCTALQQPGGAYVLNWGAMESGDGYVFIPIPAADGTKTRASDWDNANVLFIPTDMPGMNDLDALPDGVPAPEGTEEPVPGGPTRKNTPGGPITIPGGPGGG